MTASEPSPGDGQETVVSQATTETVEADPLRFGGDYPPISYRVKGSGYVRVEAADAGDRVAEPHIAVFASLTEITLDGDADTDAWSLAVSLTTTPHGRLWTISILPTTTTSTVTKHTMSASESHFTTGHPRPRPM
jgi:hypothetical protein